MKTNRGGSLTCGYRVWIASCPAQWKPTRWHDIPPGAEALRPLGDDLFSEDRAASLVEGFNRVMLKSRDRFWAVAVPATMRIDEAARPGLDVSAAAVRLSRQRKKSAS